MKPILTYPLKSGEYIKSIDSAAFSITEEEAEKVKMNALFNFKPGLPNYIFISEKDAEFLASAKFLTSD